MIRTVKPFPLGQVVATPGALLALDRTGEPVSKFLARHRKGDWGEVDAGDWKANDDSLISGARLLSAYTLDDSATKIWIITEAVGEDGTRESTCVLLPDEY